MATRAFGVVDHVAFGVPAIEWYLNFFDQVFGMRPTKIKGNPELPEPGSEEEFITEHYWGYAAQSDGGTVEYQVEHPSWNVWQVSEAEFDCDIERVYGGQFIKALSVKPSSAFIAYGSPIIVRKGVRL